MATRYHTRITWIDGQPHVQRCPAEIVEHRSSTGERVRLGSYDRDGEIVRPATDADRQAMSDGRIGYDPATHPSSLAWEAHVARGGD